MTFVTFYWLLVAVTLSLLAIFVTLFLYGQSRFNTPDGIFSDMVCPKDGADERCARCTRSSCPNYIGDDK